MLRHVACVATSAEIYIDGVSCFVSMRQLSCGSHNHQHARATSSMLTSVACLLIRDDKGRVLMQYRSKDGKLALPEGTDCIEVGVVCCNAVCKLELDEDVEAAAVREGREELGISIVKGREVSSFVSGNFLLHVYEVCSAGIPLHDFVGEPQNAEPDKHAGVVACTFIEFMMISDLMSDLEQVLPSNWQILEEL